MPPVLPRRQLELLRLTVAVGYCATVIPSRYASAWVVRLLVPGQPSVIRSFSQRTGDELLSRGLIKPDLEHPRRRGKTVTIRRYVPTRAAYALLARSTKSRGNKR